MIPTSTHNITYNFTYYHTISQITLNCKGLLTFSFPPSVLKLHTEWNSLHYYWYNSWTRKRYHRFPYLSYYGANSNCCPGSRDSRRMPYWSLILLWHWNRRCWHGCNNTWRIQSHLLLEINCHGDIYFTEALCLFSLPHLWLHLVLSLKF